MKSNGGVLSAAEVVHQPVSTVLSGPAAGALGAALVTTAAGFDRVLTLDGGGTSTDVSVVLGGEPTLTTEGSVGGYPSKIPMIDVVTVGAGGGSVAWLSREGGLKVGPRSAGADPGPMCYGRGGTEPTVTDANLVLGRIPPHLLGGEVPLDPAAARGRAGGARVQARPGPGRRWPPGCWRSRPGTRPTPCARSPSSAAWTSATSPWPPSAGRGRWPLCRLLELLGLPAAVVPRDPGNLSAFGLLTVDVKNDEVQTRGRPPRRPRPGRRRRHPRRPPGTGRPLPGRRGLRPPRPPLPALGRPALLRPGLRGPGPGSRRPGRHRAAPRPPSPPSTTPTSASTATASATTPPSRSSGSTSASPASAPSAAPTLRPLAARRHGWARRAPGPPASTPRVDLSTRRSIDGPTWGPGTVSRGRRWWRSTGPPSRSTRGSGPRSTGSATWS